MILTTFFKYAWTIVGDDVVNAILHFVHTNIMIHVLNSTSVALVPKCQNPSSIKDFRPISCCIIIYKCIIKIMANKLKKYMPLLVGYNQNAFIVVRSIIDNVLFTQELVRGSTQRL